MMIILTKEEYDDLVQKATAGEALAEQKAEAKAEAMKAQIKEGLIAACKRDHLQTPEEIIYKLREILTHY